MPYLASPFFFFIWYWFASSIIFVAATFSPIVLVIVRGIYIEAFDTLLLKFLQEAKLISMY